MLSGANQISISKLVGIKIPVVFHQSKALLTEHLCYEYSVRIYVYMNPCENMAGEELSTALRDLPNRVLNVPVEERPILFSKVCSVLSNPGINSTIIRGICKVLGTTLTKYKDYNSQLLVRNLLIDLLKAHHDLTVEHMLSVFKSLILKELTSTSTHKSSKPAFVALGWSVLLMKHANLSSNIFKTEFLRLVEYQSSFYKIAVSCGQTRVIEASEKMLFELWELSNIFRESTMIVEKEPSVDTFLMSMLMVQYENQKEKTILRKYKQKLMEHFIKVIITSKIKPQGIHVALCKPLLITIEKSEFESNIYPPLQRATLRSPENILEAVGIIVSYIPLDFSPYALQIGNVLIRNLYCKNDAARIESVESLKKLSEKCVNGKVIEELIKHIFAILNGSDGKISVLEYRINLLQGAGNLSFNSVDSDCLPGLLKTVINLFAAILEMEIQEKFLCHVLDMFSLWTSKLTGPLPEIIISIFEKGLRLKNTTHTVRQSYLQWLLASLQYSNLKEDSNIVSVLVNLYEKAMQNTSIVAQLSEAICIACILLKTIKSLNIYSYFWGTILDMNKQYFFHEKFISSASLESLCHVSLMAEQLLTKYSKDIKGPTDIISRAILHNLVSTSRKVRSYSISLLPNITKSNEAIHFVLSILSELDISLHNIKFHYDTDGSQSSDESSTPSQVVLELLNSLCSLRKLDDKNAQCIGIKLFLICQHPAVVRNDSYFWENILKQKLNLDVQLFISENLNEISDICISKFQDTDSYKNAISTLVRIQPNLIIPRIITKIKSHLKHHSLIHITDDEYFTYLTPDNELYDKSILPNSESLYNTIGLKRENKVYSYKEQLEELQLRREIEEKRLKEGKGKPPKLTLKQQEVLKNQMEKEKRIRIRLKAINENLLASISLLEAACVGNSTQVALYFSEILPVILNALQSPLAAEPLCNLYYFLNTICFDSEKNLSHDIAVATINLEQPHCDLKREWTLINLHENLLEIIKKLHDLVICSSNNTVSFAKNSFPRCMSVPSFTYAFEFLRRALTEKSVLENEEHFLLGVNIIEMQAQLIRSQRSNDIPDVYQAKFMPRVAMFTLLINLVKSQNGSRQTHAASALLEVAKLTSGNQDAIIVGEEIELFLEALQSVSDVLRDLALRTLQIMSHAFNFDSNLNLQLKKCIAKRLWIAMFDVSLEIRALAENIWKQSKLNAPEFEELIVDILHSEFCIQKATSASLVPLLSDDVNLTSHILKKLLSVYHEKLIMIPPKLDQFDREIEPATDQWKSRRGVAISLSQIAQFLSIDDIDQLMQFMVTYGLGDRDEIVHKEMLAAALAVVDIHGKESIVRLLPVFEDFLDKAPNSQSFDNIRQAVVILMGSLARHLERNDNRIEPIVKRLLAALTTPSQQVQEAVANCLPYLMPSVKEEAPAMVKKLLHQLAKSEKYGERRGAAYGIAGIVKGLGILSLKQLDIMSKLTTYIQEKKNYKSREGALFAFEVLCTTLGRLFEPYIVHVLPHLLQCFGDSSQYVRQAADDTAKVVMGRLSAHGVKLVLPSLLDALDEDSWRTKTASVELLGAMAFCAPKQLSSCLPNIVPKLIEVLGDSHTKVQEAGADALKVIGSVIKNPEIQAIVPILLKALEDPSNNTPLCLQSLLKTKFVHFIDAPSLALIMPVVQRAFMDRSTETRKMSAQIIGNMYSLTDQKDLTPYLPNIIPGLKSSLLDPVPEVRAVSARALGAMVKGMGETSFEDLLPWLMQTLTSESSSVDRSGAAQGLSEVVGGLGVEKMHRLMPEIIATAERTDIAPHVKDGYIMMFIYMPGAFPKEFTPYIGQIINPILKALADENEYVRDTALKAGQRIVNMYAETAVTLLLPELEKGLFDDNWRIRYSSVQLLGDLLYRISGVSGKMTTETASEDDNFGTEQSHKAIIHFLGDERRNRVLSGLYMGRSDVSLMVRQSALHVWKVVVTNTPRTLREILPTLFGLLLGCLASTSYDKRQVAARTLGDLVRKLGERVLPEIIPILERGLNSEQADQRQGVCIGLSEIMGSTSKEMVLTFVNSLVPTVRKALCDPLPEVREAAAKTFDSLHSTVGSRALDDILPSMLEGLSDPDPVVAENTLDGLRQVMFIKSKVVLPYLVPQLTASPVNTKALSILVSVAGEALTKYLPKILSALLDALSEAQCTVREQQELEYCQTVILSVVDEVGIRTIMDTLMTSAKSNDLALRKSSSSLLSAFCIHSPGDYSQYVPQLLRCLLRLMADTDKDILQRSWDALNAVIKALDSTQQISYVSDVRQAVRFAASDLKQTELPGFCLPKGITPLLPVFREAILNGLPEEKENAAQGLGEVISLANAQSLQPSVVHITGPLIRILGDRFNAGVKAAVLETLAILLYKVGVMLKQFLPQLQTTFLKALHDQNRAVRMKAGYALAELVKIHSRADPIFNEIHNGIKNTDDSAIRETMLQALRTILIPSGEKMSESIRKQVYATLLSMLAHQEDITRSAVGGCLGTLLKYLPGELINEMINQHIINGESDESLIRHGQSVVVFVALKESSKEFFDNVNEEKILSSILAFIASDKIQIVFNGIRAATYLIEYNLTTQKVTPNSIIVAFTRAMNHNSNDVKQLVAKSCSHIARTHSAIEISPELIKYLIPMLVNGTKEKNGYVKSNSELALISILRLKDNDSIFLKICQMLESGARDSLTEVVSKVLRKATLQPTAGKEEELDDTMLT